MNTTETRSPSLLIKALMFAFFMLGLIAIMGIVHLKTIDLQQQINQLRKDAGVIHTTE